MRPIPEIKHNGVHPSKPGGHNPTRNTSISITIASLTGAATAHLIFGDRPPEVRFDNISEADLIFILKNALILLEHKLDQEFVPDF